MMHRLLEIAPYHLSNEKARAKVVSLLRSHGLRKPKRGWERVDYTDNTGKSPVQLRFREMRDEARKTGTVERLQKRHDATDPVFGGTFLLATTSQMELSMSWAGYDATVKGPGRFAPVEGDLMDDILDYREAAWEHSYEDSLSRTTRAYRAYLHSCMSLVDAFINRYVHIARHNGNGKAVKELARVSRTVDRIEQWLAAFTKSKLADLSGSKEWDHFQKLRTSRNALTHAVEPFFGTDLKTVARELNLCRAGIGGFLRRLRELEGQRPLFFTERLESAPLVELMPRGRQRK